MRIILKHTLKNVFKKPLRSILVIFCVMVCAFTALLSFDMTGSIRFMISSLFSSQLGEMDIITAGNITDDFVNDSKFENCTYLKYYDISEPFYSDIDNQYTYVHKEELCVMGMDIETAYKMQCLPYDGELKENEILVNLKFAEKFSYEEGDTVIIHDVFGGENELTIKEVLDVDNLGLFRGCSAVVNMDTYKALSPNGKCEEVYFCIPEGEKTKDYIDYIEENYPNINAVSVFENEEIEEQIGYITKLFFILFAICMLMVIFVTISVSERIVCERMATVGTLRSLGLSVGLTTAILLLENAFYGVVGSSIGCILYNKVRLAFLGSMMSTSLDVELTFGSINPFLIIMVIIGAVVIECLCPIKEVIKAAKTPIRDIIFANKDTAYRANKTATIVGIVSIVVALILIPFGKYFWCSLSQFALMTVSLACLFPYVVTFIGKHLEKLFYKLNKPVWQLAATELYTKKSTVGGATLISTAVALAVVVYTFSMSLLQNYQYELFTSDVYVICDGKTEVYDYSFINHLDGVNDVEYVYYTCDYVNINGTKFDPLVNIVSQDDDGFTYFKCFPETPVLAEDEIAVGREFAKKNNINEGDIISIDFGVENYYPLHKEFTVSKIVKTTRFDSTDTTILINEQTYKDVYGNEPRYIFVSCDDASKVDELIEKYAEGKLNNCYTQEEEKVVSDQKRGAVIAVLYIAIGIGIGLTFVGAVTNMLVGFEGRKRECAVIMSTSMPRKKLASLFRIESFLSSGIALLVSLPIGILMTVPVFKALTSITLTIDKVLDVKSLIGFILLMWIIFTLTSRFPIKALKKMKISEQLKYE